MEDTREFNGYKITITQDADYFDGPLDWTTPEERGAAYCLKMRRYDLPWELDAEYDEDGNDKNDLDRYSSWTEFAEARAPENMQHYKFVRWYEHSGVAVSLIDTEGPQGWDAGIAGVIFGESEDAIEGTFLDWKCYIEGDIWSVTVEDINGNFVDSLSGIYGYDYAEREGEAIAIYDANTNKRATHKPQNARELHR